MTDLPSAEYQGIRFTADHLAIMDGRVEAVSVPLARVRSLTLQRGFTAERPLLEALLDLPASFSVLSQCVPQSFGYSGVGMFLVL